MKDEEMAEKEYENCKFEDIEHYCDKAIYVTGFLAGLKAGRQDEQLTKAIKLLEKWVDLHLTTSVQAETKQFLKKIE